MQRWGQDAIRFMKDASEYGSYYEELTSFLLPHLPIGGHICDAGCGLGYLAQELAKHIKMVTAIDSSEAAIAELRQRVHQENLIVRCDDIFEQKECFDAMIFCYFGKTDEILSLAKKLCKEIVLVVKRDCSEHTFSIGKVHRKKHPIETLTKTLDALNVPYRTEHIALELGQPFTSICDAVNFYRLYNKSKQIIDEQIVKRRLCPIDHPKYAWYLPSVRKMELVVFLANDLRSTSK